MLSVFVYYSHGTHKQEAIFSFCSCYSFSSQFSSHTFRVHLLQQVLRVHPADPCRAPPRRCPAKNSNPRTRGQLDLGGATDGTQLFSSCPNIFPHPAGTTDWDREKREHARARVPVETVAAVSAPARP
jgi:hypothetical protein